MSYISTSKTFLFKDELRQRDELGNRLSLRGDLTMTDDTGRVIFRNLPNLIVLRGRLHVMEMLFGADFDSTEVGSVRTGGPNPFITSSTRRDRTIWGFCVGRGNQRGNAALVAPDAEDRRLWYQIPIRRSLMTNAPDGSVGVGTSPNPEDRDKYGSLSSGLGFAGEGMDRTDTEPSSDRFAAESSSRRTQFYKKFDIDADNDGWSIARDGGEIYRELVMKIDEHDCRVPPESGHSFTNHLISEVGLVIATQTASGNNIPNTLADVELISRLSFESEPLHNSKELEMTYRVYA